MFYDLNVPWTQNNDRELQRTIAFLDELGYDVVALTHTISGKLPSDLTCPIPRALSFATPPRLRLLRRCNILLTDTTTNHRIPQLLPHYDLLSVRPKDEKTLRLACETLDIDIVSLDLGSRFPTHFKFKMLSSAISRGVKIEICYSQGILLSDPSARRNLINNVTALIRTTRGRGLLFSSEARSALGVRAPSDVINLATVWGLGPERGKDGLTKEARSVVEFAHLKRTSYRGAVNIIYGGEKPAPKEVPAKDKKGERAQGEAQKKRKFDAGEGASGSQAGKEITLSNREKKRREKRARYEANQKNPITSAEGSGISTPMEH